MRGERKQQDGPLVPRKASRLVPNQGWALAGSKRNRSRQEGQGDNCIAGVHWGDVRALTRGTGRRRRQTQPLEDADAEAFCRIYARIVLRVKGLAGLPKPASAEEEVQGESA